MRKLKRWQIPFFAFASFGPCMLSTIISVYLVDALQVAGFGADLENWTFAAKTITVSLFLRRLRRLSFRACVTCWLELAGKSFRKSIKRYKISQKVNVDFSQCINFLLLLKR